jgi:hypothetical protein
MTQDPEDHRTPDEQPSQFKYFLALPAEIRIKIYDILLTSRDDIITKLEYG